MKTYRGIRNPDTNELPRSKLRGIWCSYQSPS